MGVDLYVRRKGGGRAKCRSCDGIGTEVCYACDQDRPCIDCRGKGKGAPVTTLNRCLRDPFMKRYPLSGDWTEHDVSREWLEGLADAGSFAATGASELLEILEEENGLLEFKIEG